MDEATPRDHLLHHLRHVASQRLQQAQDWPGDAAKCENSAASLRSLAAYVAALDEADDALQCLDLLFPDGDFWTVVEALKSHRGKTPVAHMISRYGRSSRKLQTWEHRAMLAELLTALARRDSDDCSLIR